jgi:hypothetical protein
VLAVGSNDKRRRRRRRATHSLVPQPYAGNPIALTGEFSVLCARSTEAMVRHHEVVPVTDDPISEFLSLALAYRSAAREQADLYEMLYTPTAAPGQSAVEYPQQVQRTIGRVQDTIRRASLAGQLRPLDDHELFQGLWGIVHGLTSLELRGVLGTPEECDRIWRETITTHVRGFAASG